MPETHCAFGFIHMLTARTGAAGEFFLEIRRLQPELREARGLNYGTESACATGTHAIGEAAAAVADAARRLASAGVEDVRRDHALNLRAWTRCWPAISSSSARTR